MSLYDPVTETRDPVDVRWSEIALHYAKSVPKARTVEAVALAKRAAAERADDSSNDWIRESLRLQRVEAVLVANQWQEVVGFLERDAEDRAARA